GGTQLVGYVVLAAGCAADAGELRAHVGARLPEYMVPSAIVVVDGFPLTANGKLDRSALPAPEFRASVGRLPRSPQEELLCALFAEVLGGGRVGIDDDFFALGGHSLLATRLISRIRSSLDVEVSIRSLFEARTVCGLVECLRDARVGRAALRAVEHPAQVPLRAHLFALGAREHVLLLVLHHIAGDGWSLGPLGRDLSRSYAARVSGGVADFAPLGVQYADYTLWQQAVLGDESDADSALSRELSFWRDRLAGLPEQIALPFDRPRPAVSSYRGGSVELRLSASLHGGLLRL